MTAALGVTLLGLPVVLTDDQPTDKDNICAGCSGNRRIIRESGILSFLPAIVLILITPFIRGMFIVKSSPLRTILLACLACLFFFEQANLVSGATVRLAPLNQRCVPGERIEYALLGEGLDGLGSAEVTLRYSPDMLQNSRVIFDEALQNGSALIQSNTNLLGTVRIGIIDAMGFSDYAGELARVSFDASDMVTGNVELCGEVHVTNLQGKTVFSQIEVEPTEVGWRESSKRKEKEELALNGKNLTVTSFRNPSSNAGGDSPLRSIPIFKGKQDRHKITILTSQEDCYPGTETAPQGASLHSAFERNLERDEPELVERYVSRSQQRPNKDTPISFVIQQVQGKSNLYQVIIDPSGEKFSFALTNGEILKLVKLGRKVELRIRAEKGCLLYLILNDIERIPLGCGV